MSSKIPKSKKQRLHQRQFRLYIGNGNWVTLPEPITNDLLEIYERGVAARYHVAPGLAFDIIPNDMDCNSRNASLPKLMRVDLCYEGADDISMVQERLSLWVKNVLEVQGTVDAFPPPTINPSSSDRKDDNGPPTLPRVMSMDPHRHLHLVPSLPLSVAGRRKTPIAQTPTTTCDNTSPSQSHPIQSLTTTSDHNPLSSRHHITTTQSSKSICIRRRQQSPCSLSTSSLYWTNPNCNDSTLLASFRERQQMGSYDAFLQLPHGPPSSWHPLGDTMSFSSHDRHLAETYRDGGHSSSDINICDDALSFPNWPLIGADNMDQQQHHHHHQQVAIVNQRSRLNLNPLLAHTPQEPGAVQLNTVSSLSQSPPAAVFLSSDNGVLDQSLPESPKLTQCSMKAKEVELCTRVSDTA